MATKKPLINKLPEKHSVLPSVAQKPLINKLNEAVSEKTKRQYNPLPKGATIQLSGKALNYSGPKLYEQVPSETIQATPVHWEMVKTLIDLKILDPKKTFLEVMPSAGKSPDRIVVRTLKDDMIETDLRKIFTFTTFSTEGLLITYGETQSNSEPFRAAIYKKDTLQKALQAFSLINTKPTMKQIGDFAVLKALYLKLADEYVATVVTFPHKFPLKMLLCETQYYPLEELEDIKVMPGYFLKPLLLEVYEP